MNGTEPPALNMIDRLMVAAGFAARRLPVRGRARLARLMERHAPATDLPYRDQWGFNRVADLRDDVEALGFTGVYTLPPQAARLVRPGDWVIDAGANVGCLTAQLCALTGPSGQVWAIEPLPRNVARLQQFKQANHLDRLTIFAGGLGAEEGELALRLPVEGQSAYASFTKSWDMEGEIRVPVWPLDRLIEQHRPDRPLRLLKIDVEGFEPQVLRGAESTLRRFRPLVMCEFNDVLLRDAGSSSRDVLRQFAQLGYCPHGDEPPLDGRVLDLVLHPR